MLAYTLSPTHPHLQQGHIGLTLDPKAPVPGRTHTPHYQGSPSQKSKGCGGFQWGRNTFSRADSANKVCIFDSELGDRMLLASCGGHQKGPCSKESDPGMAVVLRLRCQGKPVSQRHGTWYSSVSLCLRASPPSGLPEWVYGSWVSHPLTASSFTWTVGLGQLCFLMS